MTAPDLDAIIAKVQKLLNTEGRTPEEAAAYVAKAHAILAEYDLSIEDVGQLKADPRTAVRKAEGVASTTEGKPDGWKSDILLSVAALFECKVLRGGHMEQTKSGKYRRVMTYHMVGFGHDLEAAHYAHSFLVGEITRLAKAHSKPMWDAIREYAADRSISVHLAESWYTQDHGTHPLKAELYFIKGAAEAVVEGMNRERRDRDWKRRTEEAEGNPNALVVMKKDELDDFIGRDQYGDRWPDIKRQRAEQEARWQEQSAAYRAAAEARRAEEEAKHAAETPEQHARCEAREAKEQAKRDEQSRREQERANNRYWKEQDKIDHRAHRAGREAGAGISIRPGVGTGTGSDKIGG